MNSPCSRTPDPRPIELTFGGLAEQVAHANSWSGCWGQDPSQRARAGLSSYVLRLRQALGSAALEWRSGGYVLVIDPEVPRYWSSPK